MKNLRTFLFISLFLFIPLVAANGLQFYNSSSVYNLNKTIDQDVYIQFSLKNEEPEIFYNITIENNPVMSFPIIPQLLSGGIVTVNATIFGDTGFSGNLRIKGLYYNNIGKNYLEHFIDVYYINGTSECTKSVIEGDRVTFNNFLNGNINMKNYDTSEIITTIPQGATYTINFDISRTLNYYFTYIGYPFTGKCSVTSLTSQGYVNNPETDALLSLNLLINYPPTDLQLTVLTSNYTISAGSSTSDILNIRNTGNQVARSIILSGEWFSFGNSNFDLLPGESRNIGYTITPIITNTSQTNIIYTKIMIVSGNFQILNKSFTIFIPYSNVVVSINNTIQSLESKMRDAYDFLNSYCNEDMNKNKEFCQLFKNNAVINSYANGTININPNDWMLEISKAMIDLTENLNKETNANKIARDDVNNSITSLRSDYSETLNGMIELKSKQDDNSNLVMVLLSVFLGVPTICGLSFLIIRRRRNLKLEKLKKLM